MINTPLLQCGLFCRTFFLQLKAPQMTSKIISFTVPVAITDFNVIIDDGRIYHIHRTPTLLDHDTVIAEVTSNSLILSNEYSEPASSLEGGEGEEMTQATAAPPLPPTILGNLINEPIGDDLIIGYTIREGTIPITPTNNHLLSSLNSSFLAASNLFTNELRKLDETYHVSEKVKAFDNEYKVSETTKKATDRVVENVNTIDQTYKISETVQTTASSLDEKYHLRDNVKSAAMAVSNATIAASTLVMSKASAIDETYHVTENVKSAVGVVSSKAHEIDEKYHVTDAVKGTAEAVVNEVRKASENFRNPEATQEPAAATDPEMDEETHFHE
jgi:methyl-accepting chemotaxis protein